VTFAWIRRFEEALSLVIEWPQSVTAYHDWIQSFSPVRDELEYYKPAMDEYLKKAYPQDLCRDNEAKGAVRQTS